MLTYGDGIGDVNVAALANFHKSHGRIATVTARHPPPGRFKSMEIDPVAQVVCFREKSAGDGLWINIGFLSCSRQSSISLKATRRSGKGAYGKSGSGASSHRR